MHSTENWATQLRSLLPETFTSGGTTRNETNGPASRYAFVTRVWLVTSAVLVCVGANTILMRLPRMVMRRRVRASGTRTACVGMDFRSHAFPLRISAEKVAPQIKTGSRTYLQTRGKVRADDDETFRLQHISDYYVSHR